MIHIFSDGACLNNPGPGSFGTIIRFEDGREEILTGFLKHTTNNQMELMGVIAGLAYFKNPIHCTVTTDSQYVSRGINEWLPKWVTNQWRSKVSKQAIKNKGLWQKIDMLIQRHFVRVVWTRGHAGHLENERCHALAHQVLKSRLDVKQPPL